jgi:hypothetical protein
MKGTRIKPFVADEQLRSVPLLVHRRMGPCILFSSVESIRYTQDAYRRTRTKSALPVGSRWEGSRTLILLFLHGSHEPALLVVFFFGGSLEGLASDMVSMGDGSGLSLFQFKKSPSCGRASLALFICDEKDKNVMS